MLGSINTCMCVELTQYVHWVHSILHVYVCWVPHPLCWVQCMYVCEYWFKSMCHKFTQFVCVWQVHLCVAISMYVFVEISQYVCLLISVNMYVCWDQSICSLKHFVPLKFETLLWWLRTRSPCDYSMVILNTDLPL